jgi:hypothetical protein
MRRLHGIVLLLCLFGAMLLIRHFFWQPRVLWDGLLHDRNGHYGYGQDMALAVEQGNPLQFFVQLGKGKVWPPVHGLLVMVTQVFTGNDWRFAVLPSLLGWLLMTWCVYYTAQKNAASTGIRWAAGLIALAFAMLSPGGRAYATDIMLESLGAGLTMLSLACYTRAVEERDSTLRWRVLALVLTVLFFEKYNYWMIAVASLAVAEAPVLLQIVRGWMRGKDARSLALTQLREPLNWLVLVLAAAVLWVSVRGPGMINLFGKPVSLYPPNNLVTITFAVFFARVLLGMWRAKWEPATAEEAMLWKWHILPLAISFLLPQRLGVFFGFLSPTNNDNQPHKFTESVQSYLHWYSVDYSVSIPMAILAAVLAFVALSQFKKLPPGARAVLICMVIGITLNLLHPNQKSRFMHSWIPAVWTVAGIGAAIVIGKLPRREWVAGGVVAALAVYCGSTMWAAANAQAASSYSLLNMSDQWMADAAGSQPVAFCSSQPARTFMQWTFLNQYHSRARFEWPAWQDDTNAEKMRADFAQWLATTKADTLVYLEVQPGSADFVTGCDFPVLREQMDGLMKNQTQFKETKVLDFPLQHCAVMIWHAAAK